MSRSTTELMEEANDLKAKIDTIQGRISAFQREMSGLQGQVVQMEADRRSILGEIERRTRPVEKAQISDHALLRYIERVYEIDMNALRDHILTPTIAEAIHAGATTVTVDGVQFRVKDRNIVTVLTNEQKTHKKAKRHGRREDRDDDNVRSLVDAYYAEQDA